MTRMFLVLVSFAFFLALGIQPLSAGGEAPAKKAESTKTSTKIKGDVKAASEGWVLIDQGALLIDVRSTDEYKSGYIEGSLNIPHTQVQALADAIGPDKSRAVVFYCRTGRRVGVVQKQLEKMGYSGIFNATGYEALVATRP